MAMDVNKALPAWRRIPPNELGNHFWEIKRLHEEVFTVSSLRTTWFVLTWVSALSGVIAFILGVQVKR